MSTLQENLNAIKLDKDTNLTPENLKKGITCLGVTGTYEGSGGGSSDYNAKLVPVNGGIRAYITKISENLDTSGVTSMSGMFQNCENLTTIPLLDTSNVTTMQYMFQNCYNLTTIPLLDTSSVTTMQYMFDNCPKLTEIPLLDTSSVTTTYYMFMNCRNLATVPLLSLGSVDDVYNMFYSCTSLSDESLNNILAMCANSAYRGTKTLKYIGLTSAQATKCTTLNNYSTFTSAGWTTGY